MDMRCFTEDWGPNPHSAMHAAHLARRARLGIVAPRAVVDLRPFLKLAAKALTPAIEPVVAVKKAAQEPPHAPEPDPPAPLQPKANAMKILAEVARKHQVLLDDILGARRDAQFMRARRETAWRLYNETLWSLPRIGRFMNKDHTTILHAIRKCQESGLKRYSLRDHAPACPNVDDTVTAA